jgi:hypothetical protein
MMLCSVVKLISVLVKYTASIYRLEGKQTTSSSETLINICPTTQHHISEDSTLHSHCHDNLNLNGTKTVQPDNRIHQEEEKGWKSNRNLHHKILYNT